MEVNTKSTSGVKSDGFTCACSAVNLRLNNFANLEATNAKKVHHNIFMIKFLLMLFTGLQKREAGWENISLFFLFHGGYYICSTELHYQNYPKI